MTLHQGDRVHHPQFGNGTVCGRDGGKPLVMFEGKRFTRPVKTPEEELTRVKDE
jgi:hypothetical protein